MSKIYFEVGLEGGVFAQQKSLEYLYPLKFTQS